MRIALFSDIHGNITGLRAILAHLDTRGGADICIAAGDLVVGGPGGDEIFELLLEREAQMVYGNHEGFAVDYEAYIQRIPEQWRDWALRDTDWQRVNLSPAYWDLLTTLPMKLSLALESDKKLFVCHAAPNDPWAYVCAHNVSRDVLQATYGSVDADVIAYGHMHQHHTLWMDAKLLINVASIGMRSDGLSAYTLLENTNGQLAVQQFQVPYDTAEETRLIQLRGVPQP